MTSPSLDRITDYRYSEAIGEALDRLPGGIRQRLSHVRFVCGVDPVFAGLHSYDTYTDGRSYSGTAHCCYPFNLRGPRERRTTTIVLPTIENAEPAVIVHELGHALHAVPGLNYQAVPITPYASETRYEAFAEAFLGWTHWYGDQDAAHSDERTRALFRELAVS